MGPPRLQAFRWGLWLHPWECREVLGVALLAAGCITGAFGAALHACIWHGDPLCLDTAIQMRRVSRDDSASHQFHFWWGTEVPWLSSCCPLDYEATQFQGDQSYCGWIAFGVLRFDCWWTNMPRDTTGSLWIKHNWFADDTFRLSGHMWWEV